MAVDLCRRHTPPELYTGNCRLCVEVARGDKLEAAVARLQSQNQKLEAAVARLEETRVAFEAEVRALRTGE